MNTFGLRLLVLSMFFMDILCAQKPSSTSVMSTVNTIPQFSKKQVASFRKQEDSLKILSDIFMWDTLSLENRKKACYRFIPKVLQALKQENSFYYPFDSLKSISKVYSPDSTFRIFTWQLHYPKGKFRYFGFIQMRSTDLKIFPLRDLRDTLPYHTQQILTPNNWYGSVYYNIVKQTINRQNVYTLFGFEAANFTSRRKIVEILTFDENRNPEFGAPLFHFKDSSAVKILDTLNRFFIEYKWNASPTLNYDKELDIIVYDHLASVDPSANGATFAYVPDGQYEGFKWIKNRWQWIQKVFTFAINEDDNPPIPAPLFGLPKKQPVLPTDVEKY
jgi:hypothetical protein